DQVADVQDDLSPYGPLGLCWKAERDAAVLDALLGTADALGDRRLRDEKRLDQCDVLHGSLLIFDDGCHGLVGAADPFLDITLPEGSRAAFRRTPADPSPSRHGCPGGT